MDNIIKLNNQFQKKVPEDDSKSRLVCKDCDFIYYENPKIIAGILPVINDDILLCKRSIEPQKGLWTFPCGYLECGETLEEGALREAREEAGISVQLGPLLTIYSVPHVDQVHLFFLGELPNHHYEVGEETEAIKFVQLNEINEDEIAFSSALFTINTYKKFLANQITIPQIGSLKK